MQKVFVSHVTVEINKTYGKKKQRIVIIKIEMPMQMGNVDSVIENSMLKYIMNNVIEILMEDFLL